MPLSCLLLNIYFLIFTEVANTVSPSVHYGAAVGHPRSQLAPQQAAAADEQPNPTQVVLGRFSLCKEQSGHCYPSSRRTPFKKYTASASQAPTSLMRAALDQGGGKAADRPALDVVQQLASGGETQVTSPALAEAARGQRQSRQGWQKQRRSGEREQTHGQRGTFSPCHGTTAEATQSQAHGPPEGAGGLLSSDVGGAASPGCAFEHLATQESLPESVRSLVAQATQTTAKTEAKALHKLVAQRQEALSSLERIKHERAAYEQGWATYSQSLLDILAQQFADRTENLRKMDEAQSQWAAKLAETAKALKQATKDKSDAIEVHSGDGSEDEDDMEAMDAEVDQAAQEAPQAELRQQRQAAAGEQIKQALTAVRDEAAAGAAQRERTPRRRGHKESTDEAGDKDKEGGSTGKEGSGKKSQLF